MSKSKSASGNAIAELYTSLIQKGNLRDLLPFLRLHAHADKAVLRQEIKKAKKYWLDYIELPTGSVVDGFFRTSRWGQRGNEQQQEMVILSAIAVLDKTEIMRWDDAFPYFSRLDEPFVREVVTWAKPTWTNAFLLDQLKKNAWSTLDYFHLKLLEERGLVEYEPELFVLSMTKFPFRFYRENSLLTAYMEKIVNDPLAWQRELPLLFQYETGIQNQNMPMAWNEPFKNVWEMILGSWLDQGRFDRAWFVENCILVQTKEWNGGLRAFFRKRLADALPTTAELLAAQYPLFACLHAPLNTVVSFAVDLIRKIWSDKNFEFQSFIEFIEPVMMRADCKGAIRHTLTILDKAAQQSPRYRPAVSYLAADVLVIPDLSLQERAVKTLKKTGDPNDAVLTDKLNMYAPQLQGNIMEMLGPLLTGNIPEIPNLYEAYATETSAHSIIHDASRFPEFMDWNDLLFHFGKFIQSEEVMHAEMLMDAFVTKRHLFPTDALEQLKTYADQLSGLYFNAPYRRMVGGLLIHLIRQEEGFYQPERDHLGRSEIGNLAKYLVHQIQEKIVSGSKRSLLCFPTHAPHWIDPSIIIDRLIAYAHAGEAVDPVDFAIAISRTRRENIPKAVEKAHRLPQQYQQLMAFVLGTTAEIPAPEKPSIWKKLFGSAKNINYVPWAVAARTFYPNQEFQEFENTDLKGVVNVVSPFAPEVRIDVRRHETRHAFSKKVDKSTTRRLIATLPKSKWSGKQPLLYSMDIYERKDSVWGINLSFGTVLFWHSVMPQNDQALASFLLRYCCEYSEGLGEDDLRAFLLIVSDTSFVFTDTIYYVIACCYLYKDSGLRNFAAEVSLLLICERRIDVRQLAEKLARLISEGYAPLQRFLDVAAVIRDHSALHNGALLTLLETIVERFELKEKLPAGFKKLLEMYYDLLTKTGQAPGVSTLQNLTKIPESPSLKPIIKQLQSIPHQ